RRCSLVKARGRRTSFSSRRASLSEGEENFVRGGLLFTGRCEGREDQGAKVVVDVVRRERASTLYPPVQDKNERRGYVLDNKIWRNLGCFPASLKFFANVIGNQFRQYFSKMFMNDSSSSGPHLSRARVSVAMNVFEDRKAESNKPFVSLYGG